MNETWPHPGHRLYNGGRPGAGGLANFLGCLSTWVPEEIDLLGFEVGGTGNNIAMVERLARQLYGFRPPAERPAIVALDFWNTRGLKPRSSSKASPPPGNEIGSLDTGAFMNSGAVLPLARFYGWTVISEHDAFFHASTPRSSSTAPQARRRPSAARPSRCTGISCLPPCGPCTRAGARWGRTALPSCATS